MILGGIFSLYACAPNTAEKSAIEKAKADSVKAIENASKATKEAATQNNNKQLNIATPPNSTATPNVINNQQTNKNHIRVGCICRDGSHSNATGRGACSHHGGVDHWLYEDDK